VVAPPAQPPQTTSPPSGTEPAAVPSPTPVDPVIYLGAGTPEVNNQVILATPKTEKKKFPGEVERWPLELLIVYGLMGFSLLYAYFVMADSKLEEMAESIEYGGALDQEAAIHKLDTYLRLELLGIKVSYKLLKYDIVEKLLATYQTARTPALRKEVARVLCRLSKHDAIRDVLIQRGAIDIIRGHADIYNIDTLYLLTNLSEDLSPGGGMEIILKDELLFDNLMYTMAFSINRGVYEDKFIQRTIMRLFQNAFRHQQGYQLLEPYANKLDKLFTNQDYLWDSLSWIYQNNIYLYCKQNSDKHRGTEQQLLFSGSSLLKNEQYYEQSAEATCFGIGVLLVGFMSFWTAKIDQRFRTYSRFQPLKIPHKHFARIQAWKTIPIAVGLFAVHQGLRRFTEITSDEILRAEKQYDVPGTATFPQMLRNRIPEDVYWSAEETKAKHYLALLQLLKLPVLYFSITFSPFALIPSLLPWRLNPKSPPHFQIVAMEQFGYLSSLVVPREDVPDPTPAQIQKIFD